MSWRSIGATTVTESLGHEVDPLIWVGDWAISLPKWGAADLYPLPDG